MKLILSVLTIMVILAMLSLPIPYPGDDGEFNVLSGLYWCRTPQACIHERGHALDRTRGWPSQSKNYQYAVQVYMIAEIQSGKPAPMAYLIMVQLCGTPDRPWANQKAELYAEIYTAANGQSDEIPASLQPFYGEKR